MSLTCRHGRVVGPAHRTRRVDRHDLAGNEPVEQMPDRGEPLLDARRRELARPSLDPGGDMHRLHGLDRRHAGSDAPGQEFLSGAAICPARVWVADVGREEFEEAREARSPDAATTAGRLVPSIRAGS
jgi:hypothetical protein